MSVTRLQLIPFALTVLSLGACGTTPPAENVGVTVAADQGLMAVRFVSNWKGNEKWLFEPVVFVIGREDPPARSELTMRSNDDAQLIPLQAGEYSWVRVAIGPNFMNFQPDAKFTISPGEITYVGDITLLVSTEWWWFITDELKVEDNQDATLLRLRSNYDVSPEDYSVTSEIAELVFEEP